MKLTERDMKIHVCMVFLHQEYDVFGCFCLILITLVVFSSQKSVVTVNTEIVESSDRHQVGPRDKRCQTSRKNLSHTCLVH